MNVINNVVTPNKTSAFADMGVYKTNALPIASTTVNTTDTFEHQESETKKAKNKKLIIAGVAIGAAAITAIAYRKNISEFVKKIVNKRPQNVDNIEDKAKNALKDVIDNSEPVKLAEEAAETVKETIKDVAEAVKPAEIIENAAQTAQEVIKEAAGAPKVAEVVENAAEAVKDAVQNSNAAENAKQVAKDTAIGVASTVAATVIATEAAVKTVQAKNEQNTEIKHETPVEVKADIPVEIIVTEEPVEEAPAVAVDETPAEIEENQIKIATEEPEDIEPAVVTDEAQVEVKNEVPVEESKLEVKKAKTTGAVKNLSQIAGKEVADAIRKIDEKYGNIEKEIKEGLLHTYKNTRGEDVYKHGILFHGANSIGKEAAIENFVQSLSKAGYEIKEVPRIKNTDVQTICDVIHEYVEESEKLFNETQKRTAIVIRDLDVVAPYGSEVATKLAKEIKHGGTKSFAIIMEGENEQKISPQIRRDGTANSGHILCRPTLEDSKETWEKHLELIDTLGGSTKRNLLIEANAALEELK